MSDRDRRHVAWIKQRLASEWGKAQLTANAEASLRRILKTEVRKLFDAKALAELFETLSADSVLSGTIRPLMRASMLLSVARLREDQELLGAYVSQEARALVDQLLQKPGLLPDKFVKRMLSHSAFEEIARDVLDDALREFSEKVDPFKAEWGLPSLLKMRGPFSIGLGAVAKSFEAVRLELDKRIEPERKRFLQTFARKAIGMVADFVVKRNDEPQFVALRRELFAWLLEQPVGELVGTASESSIDLSERIGHAIAGHVAAMEATKRRRRAQIDLILAAHAAQPLEQALAVYGAKIEPDARALVEAAWPLVTVALDTPEADAFFTELVSGFEP